VNKIPAVLLLLCILSCSERQGAENNKSSSDSLDVQLEKFESRKRYSSFTKDILASIPDAGIEQAIVDYVYDYVLAGDPVANHAAFKKISPGLRAVYSTIVLEELVGSGGFAQYFDEPESLFIEEAVEGFRLLGAPVASRIARRAMVIVRVSGKSGTVDDRLSPLDAEFYGSSEPTGAMRIRFIRKNPSMFITKN